MQSVSFRPALIYHHGHELAQDYAAAGSMVCGGGSRCRFGRTYFYLVYLYDRDLGILEVRL